MTTRTATFVKHLDHLNMTVDDLADSVAWHERVFGFARVDGGLRPDGTPWAIVRAGDALLCLYQRPGLDALDQRARLARGVHGVNHFALRITDRQAWLATVAREGLALLYGGEVRWAHSSAWYVQDPTGHEIEVALWGDDTIRF